MAVLVKKEWLGKIRCDNCGRTLSFGVADIKAKQIKIPNNLPVYWITCKCKKKIDILGEDLPHLIRDLVDKRNKIDWDKVESGGFQAKTLYTPNRGVFNEI